MSASTSWRALQDALAVREPSCAGDDRFTADDAEQDPDLRSTCQACPVVAECRAYAQQAHGHRIAGFWAARRRGLNRCQEET